MAARGEARADVEVSTLVVPAWRLRWRAPELALVLGERAVALASARRDEVDRLRAEALVVFASNRMGRGVRTADRALDALKAAEAESEQETAWRLRVELADSARSVGAPLTGFAAVRPVLEAENVPPGLRAAALVQASECLVSVGRGEALSRALVEADHLFQADPLLDHDTTLLHRALLRAASGGQHRRWGDLQAATAACRDGLALLESLKEAESDNGQVRGRLTVELVCALLDLNKPGEASEVGTPLLERPVRAPSASTTGWLRLALATRVHLPAGRVDQARDLLRDAADSAERHQLDLLLGESLLALAHVHEVGGNLTEALANLRSAHAAERRRARAVYAVRARLAAEFSGVHRQPVGNLHDELAALLRTGTPTAPPPAEAELAPEAKQQLRQWRPVQMHRNEGVRVKRSRRAAEDMTAEGISAARAHAADRWRLVQPFGGAESATAEPFGDAEPLADAAAPAPQPGGHRQAAAAAAIPPSPAQTSPTQPPLTQGRPEHAMSGQARPHAPITPPPTADPAPNSANVAASAANLASAGLNDGGTPNTREAPITPTANPADAPRQASAESIGGAPSGARHGSAARVGAPFGGADGSTVSAGGPFGAERDDSSVTAGSPANAVRPDAAVSADGLVSGGRDDSPGAARHGSAALTGGPASGEHRDPAMSTSDLAGAARHDSAVSAGDPVDVGGQQGSAASGARPTGGGVQDVDALASGPAGGARQGSAVASGRPALAGGFVGGTGAGLGGGGGFGIAQPGSGAPGAGPGGASASGGLAGGRSVGGGAGGGAGLGGGVGLGPLAVGDLESAVADQSITSSDGARVGGGGGIGGTNSDIAGTGLSGTSADGGRGIGAGQSGGSEVSGAEAVGASPSAAGNEGGERSVPAAGLIAAAGVVRSGRRRAAREAAEGEGERSTGDQGSDPNVLDTLKAAGLLDSQRTGGRRRARDVEEDSVVSGPSPEPGEQAEPEVRTEAVPESVQWRVEAPQRLSPEESSIDMFDSPTMVQPAVRDDVPPVGLGAAFVKGPVIPTARVPQPPDFPPPPVPDFASPSPGFPAKVTVPEQGMGMNAESRTMDESTPEPQPEPDQVPTVPEPDQVPPVPVPDPVPSNPSPEVAPSSVDPVQQVQPVQPVQQAPSVPLVPPVEAVPSPASPIGATGFLSAADVERDDAPAEIPAELLAETPGDGPTGGQADTPFGVITDEPAAPTVDAPVANAPVADAPTEPTAPTALTAPTADTSAADVPVVDAPVADAPGAPTAPVTGTSATDTAAEDPTKDPFVTAVVVGGKTIDLPAIVEPTPPTLDSPSVTRASRRHKSDLSLAELLAEALVAYEDARREDEAAGRVDEDTVPITPVGPPPESAAETTAPIQRVEPAPRFDTWTLPES